MQIKVLHLISSTGLFGAENMTLELIRGLENKNVGCYLGILENKSQAHKSIIEKAHEYGLSAEIFPCRGRLDFAVVSYIKKFTVENGINLLHSHKYKTNLFSLLAVKNSKIPLISTCHNWLSDNPKMKFYEYLDKKVLRKFDRVIPVSKEIEEKLTVSGIPPHKICKIENGIDIRKFNIHNNSKAIKKELNIGEDRRVVGFVGRLDNNKGISYLLEAAKKILEDNTKIVFLIVGDGPLKEKFYKKTQTLGIEKNVIFTGNREDMPEMYHIMDIFILPSLKEGFPLAVLEAMASKLPVIATRVGDIPDILSNESGILINPESVDEIKNALMDLIYNKDKAENIARSGYKRVVESYSAELMTERYLQVYKDVLAKRITLN